MFIYGAFLYLMVYSYTTLMDRDPNALWLELVKSIIGLGIIFSIGEWFRIDNIIPFGTTFIAAYQVISVFVVGWFVFNEIGWKGKSGQLSRSFQNAPEN